VDKQENTQQWKRFSVRYVPGYITKTGSSMESWCPRGGGFRRTGKAMEQVYQCWWLICGEIFFRVQISPVLRFISICDLLTDSLSYTEQTFEMFTAFTATRCTCVPLAPHTAEASKSQEGSSDHLPS
jgi:hypothetical protein